MSRFRDALTAAMVDAKSLSDARTAPVVGALDRVMELIEAELERVRRTDDIEGDEWWQWRARWFHGGVAIAREVSEQKIEEIKSALLDAGRSNIVPALGGPLTPLALREVAKWLDVGDVAFAALAALRGEPHAPGNGVQSDLRRWADELEQGRLVTALNGPTDTEDEP